jgi:hypothetical protein
LEFCGVTVIRAIVCKGLEKVGKRINERTEEQRGRLRFVAQETSNLESALDPEEVSA